MDSNPPNPKTPPPPLRPPQPSDERDFLKHLESYLARRDGVDKLLKISRYAAKLALASTTPKSLPLTVRLKIFESSVGVSRKAFRLGKFVQDVNALRSAKPDSPYDALLVLIAYGGEGIYYFVEQFVWLSKSGLIHMRSLPRLQKISAWAEFIGYFGSVSLKIGDLRRIGEEIAALELGSEGSGGGGANEGKLRRLKEKRMLKRLSFVQDLADGLMTIEDIRDSKGGILSSPILLASAGLVSALISTHKNWLSC
ncbi:Peroxisomal membrane protein 11A [Acorus calamus]|uniref:Peroxisomal membrane protein 11A n=1 Tax=Acorus calamus TaxID=4465 RepID=A0AAV9ESJ9_ACOCL|nr:Peroxisomal membrane protein 11A [Acorus calamus]